jgi:AcrR family transcriptional regulator
LKKRGESASPAVPARPKRPLDKIRRPEILATAVELVREQGLWSVRVSDVAKRAGISPASVIYYFGTKDQLLEQAIGDADAAFYARLWPELDRLQSAVDRMACLIVRSSATEWVLWMDLWVYARRHPEMLAAERAFHSRWCTTIADVVRYGQQRGEFAACDADEVAVRLAALTDGLAIRMVLEESEFTADDYIGMSLRAVAMELGCDLELLRAAAERLSGRPDAGH